MKRLGRIVGIVGGFILAAIGILCGWLYFYTADLPSLAELSHYNPPAPSEIHTSVDGSNGTIHVVPGGRLGKYTVRAVVAAEGQPESRGPIRATVASLLLDHRPSQMYSLQVARGLVSPAKAIKRQINEIRLAEQIQRHFDQQQVLTIYVNRVYLGENSYGVEDASIRYFGKHAVDLSLDEAALLAGLIRSPSGDSPIAHPERAVESRNRVIEEMVRLGSVSSAEAEKARMAPLVVKQTTNGYAAYDWTRCALKVDSHGSAADAKVHIRAGEKYSNSPIVAFEILESGAIRNAALYRSSGVADIDRYALDEIRGMKYQQRPSGCEIIENRAVITVDFR